MPLSFQKDLDDEQVDFAIKVAEKAKQLGIDPNLAVSVAYQESRLRPNVGSSPKGALGIMQVMPGTAKAYGVDKKELIDPDTNIDVGVRVLKDMLDKFPDDPRLAVVAYNAGPAHPFFAGGELPKETENYLRSLKEFGAFESQPQVAEVQPEPQAPQVQPSQEESPEEIERRLKQNIDNQDVRQAQIYGGGAGAALGLAQGARDIGGSVVENLARKAAEGAASARNIAPVTGGMPPAAGTPSAGVSPAGPDISGGKPASGSAGFNYGKVFGLGDIEAGRATAMGNAPGSADELIKARAAALERLQGMAPAAGMAEDPTRGGLMVPKQTPYTGPRGPQGQIGGAKPPPVSPVTPKPAGALEEVTSLFRRFANTPLMRYLGPAAGGALAAGDATRVAQELRKPNPDASEIALSAVEGLGGLASIHPATAAVGIPVSAAAAAARFARDRARENERLGYKPDVIPSNPMGDFGF